MTDVKRAAQLIQQCWRDGDVIDHLPPDCLPGTVEQGYQVQAALAQVRADMVAGWKIAATAQAGRTHINVDRPLAGRLYQSIVMRDGAQVTLGANRMRVAEAEIVFTLGQDLPPQGEAYTEAQVAAAIQSVHPGLEFPDSRFADFTKVGAACLIADNACASQFVLGSPAEDVFDAQSLADHPTALYVNGVVVTQGHGRDALGGPLQALVWIANTLSALDIALLAGQFVTTGVTGVPSAIKAGDTVRADLGRLGSVTATVA